MASANQSAGASIPTDLIYNGTPIEEGYCKFPDFAQRAFRPLCTALEKIPWLAAIIGFLNDGYYNSTILDQTLQEIYSRERRLFDVVATSPAGNRIAIVASRTSNGKPRVFTNYHGVGRKASISPYEVLVPDNGVQDPLLWEV